MDSTFPHGDGKCTCCADTVLCLPECFPHSTGNPHAAVDEAQRRPGIGVKRERGLQYCDPREVYTPAQDGRAGRARAARIAPPRAAGRGDGGDAKRASLRL